MCPVQFPVLGTLFLLLELLFVKRRVHAVDIFLVEFFTQKLNGFPKPLKMNNFPFTQELDDIIYIRIVTQTQDIIVSYPRFLFWERIA